MSQTNNKLHINDTVLFKQVASVLGKGKALEELTRAYRGYEEVKADTIWDWHVELLDAFDWSCSPQGDYYWDGVYHAINK